MNRSTSKSTKAGSPSLGCESAPGPNSASLEAPGVAPVPPGVAPAVIQAMLEQRSRGDVAAIQGRWSPSVAGVVQRQESSFPEDAERQLRQMGPMQAKAAPIQFRGGPAVGVLRVKSSHVGSSLIAGHAWLSYTPTGGSERTHGTWGNVDPIGYHPDMEVGRAGAAERGTDLDATDVTALGTFIGANDAWSLINNCSSFAARGWNSVTHESLAYRSLGIPNPSALGVGITAANGGRSGGTLPSDRGSSANSVSSTSSSSVGITSNTVNSALGSGSVGGSFNASSGRGSL